MKHHADLCEIEEFSDEKELKSVNEQISKAYDAIAAY